MKKWNPMDVASLCCGTAIVLACLAGYLFKPDQAGAIGPVLAIGTGMLGLGSKSFKERAAKKKSERATVPDRLGVS